MVRQCKLGRNRANAAPALVVACHAPAPSVSSVRKYIEPAPAVSYPAPAPVAHAASNVALVPVGEYVAPAASCVALESVVEYNAPWLSQVAPAPVVEHIAPAHAVSCSAPTPTVFSQFPDASDLSSPEDEHALLGLVPVPIGTVALVENVFHGRERATCGFAWRLLDVGMRGDNSSVLGSFPRCEQRVCFLVQMLALRFALAEAGVLVETFRELATRGTGVSGENSGDGAGARVAARSMLVDHETAIFDWSKGCCTCLRSLSMLWRTSLTAGVSSTEGLIGHASTLIWISLKCVNEWMRLLNWLRLCLFSWRTLMCFYSTRSLRRSGTVVHAEFESMVHRVHDLEVWAAGP